MYPLFLKLENTACLVIGGGNIAERKTVSLLESGADVTLISPSVTSELQKLIDKGAIEYNQRLYCAGDTKGYFLIIAATNSRESNKQVYSEAISQNALINCVDDPEFCNFYVPALVKRGHLKIAVSTEGKLPMLAGRIRRFFNGIFPENMGEKLEELGELRRNIISEAGDDEEKKQEMFEKQLVPSIDAILKDVGK